MISIPCKKGQRCVACMFTFVIKFAKLFCKIFIDHYCIILSLEGPKQNTMSDHWLMIWQENVAQIVMLTNLKEGLKVL